LGRLGSDAGGIFVKEKGDDRAEGSGEEQKTEDGEEDASWMGDDAVNSGDAGAGVGEHEAEECESHPAGDVEAAASGGDRENDHDRETGESQRDDEFEVDAARVGDEQNEGRGCFERNELEHSAPTSIYGIESRHKISPHGIALDHFAATTERGTQRVEMHGVERVATTPG
jgi:hypothetical protein